MLLSLSRFSLFSKSFYLVLFSLVFVGLASGQDASTWASQKMASMSLEEKLGQIFMIRAHSNLGPDHINSVKKQITDYHVGGLCFFQGDPVSQLKLTNDYQGLATIPLLVSIDAEWGLGMRFKKDVIQYPRTLMLGAIEDNQIVYDFGQHIAKELRTIGAHINFGPVADINNNINNPVINDRSFGENKSLVTAKAYMYMKGMQDHHVMAVAKHFPGHGDTDVDSHADMPVIKHSREHLENFELFPFSGLIKSGIDGVMIAHLQIPALEPDPKIPSTLSHNIATGVLQEEMGFKGLVFTDAMEMKGVTKHYQPGEAEFKAFMAGNDVILLPADIDKAMSFFKAKLQSGELSEARLNKSCKKILEAKYKYIIAPNIAPAPANEVIGILNDHDGQNLKYTIIENAITLVRDDSRILPLRQKYTTAVINLNSTGKQDAFSKTFVDNGINKVWNINKDNAASAIAGLDNELKTSAQVVVALSDFNRRSANNFGLSSETIQAIKKLSEKHKVLLAVLGNPYALKNFDEINSVVCSYESDPLTKEITAEAILGHKSFNGRLPVTASQRSHFKAGLSTNKKFILKKGSSSDFGFNQDTLDKIDEMLKKIVQTKASPSVEVVIVKDNHIVYQNAYGYQTYEKKVPVSKFSVYDLASITKVAATTLALMKLYENGQVDIYAPISDYIPELRTTNKAAVRIDQILAHHARLHPWIPFYKKTMSEGKNPQPLEKYYRKAEEPGFTVKIDDFMYLRDDMVDSLYKAIEDTELRNRQEYVYSDLGMILMTKVIRNVSGKTLDQYVYDEFYRPLGLQNTMFNPLEKIDREDIVPTENDGYFRKQKIQGTVHDMFSAMLGGVSGHAGLFSTGEELAVIFQMLLNGGYYDTHTFLKKETIDLFTTRWNGNPRRALGFDMKNLEADDEESCNISFEASEDTFGHYGFTGTAVWADPRHNLIYIFLSNRTYPKMENNKLYREGYRSKIHTLVYHAFLPKSS